MIHVLLGSLAGIWLSLGTTQALTENEQPEGLPTKISAIMSDGTSPEAIGGLLEKCGEPRIIIIPPRPGEPMQERVVSSLAESLSQIGLCILDGERLDADQKREADLVYTESSDAAAATRVLLARLGDYEIQWSLDVTMEGPMEIYGVETWESKVDLRATLIDLMTRSEFETIAITHDARQQTRERALDQCIDASILSLADRLALPILQNWYGLAKGDGFVRVHVEGDSLQVDEIKNQLTATTGVDSVTRVLPLEPPRLLVRGSLNADELCERIGKGTPLSCRELEISQEDSGAWILWSGLTAVSIALIALMVRGGIRRSIRSAGPR